CRPIEVWEILYAPHHLLGDLCHLTVDGGHDYQVKLRVIGEIKLSDERGQRRNLACILLHILEEEQSTTLHWRRTLQPCEYLPRTLGVFRPRRNPDICPSGGMQHEQP